MKKTPKIRCPHCKGLRVMIDRFEHGHFGLCPVCAGKGTVRVRRSLMGLGR